MAFQAGKGVIDLTANTTALRGVMGAVRGAMRGFGIAAVAAAGAASGAFAGLANTIKKSLQLADVQEQAEAKLAAVIRGTGMAAGFSAEQLYKQAAALQKVTTYGDETIINAQAIIATFKNIRGEQFTRTTKVAANLATVMGTDLKSAALQVAKALNDPVTQLSYLNRSGISFSETQKEMIKNMIAAGRAAEAQSMILDVIEGQLGDTAGAAAQTFGGQVRQAMNEFGDMLEQIGFSIQPAIQPLIDKARELIPVLQSALIPLLHGVVDAVKSVGVWVVDMVGGWEKFKDLIIALGIAFSKFREIVIKSVADISKWILDLIDNVIGKAARAFGLEFEIAPGLRESLAELSKAAGDEISDAFFDGFKQAAKKGAEATEDAYKPIAEKINAPYDISAGGKKTAGQAKFESLGQMLDRMQLASLSRQDPILEATRKQTTAIEKQTQLTKRQTELLEVFTRTVKMPLAVA